jgi:hypothetical protein
VQDRQGNQVAFNRRGALLAAGLTGAGRSAAGLAMPGAAPAMPGPWTSEFLSFSSLEQFRQAWRIQRSLKDEDEILHWYHFIMVAVPVGRAPQPVVRWEGIELSAHRRIGTHRYRLHGHNLSFARDMATGRFVSEVRNPVTGRMVRPRTMALTGDPGYDASPEGIVPLDAPAGTPPRPKYGMIRREGALVKIDAIRVPPADWPGTFLEMGTEAVSGALFDDPSQDWLPAEVSGAYVFPYPDWMEMGDAPGHMFAAWSGHKLRAVNQLPAEFLARARAEHPELLSVDRVQFERTSKETN